MSKQKITIKISLPAPISIYNLVSPIEKEEKKLDSVPVSFLHLYFLHKACFEICERSHTINGRVSSFIIQCNGDKIYVGYKKGFIFYDAKNGIVDKKLEKLINLYLLHFFVLKEEIKNHYPKIIGYNILCKRKIIGKKLLDYELMISKRCKNASEKINLLFKTITTADILSATCKWQLLLGRASTKSYFYKDVFPRDLLSEIMKYL